MVATTGGLSSDEITIASDPASCRDVFWQSLARGNKDVATDALRRCSVPPVVQEDVFSFDDEMMDRETAGESGTLNLTVEPDTSSAVMNGWNNERKAVRLIRIDFDKM